MTWFVEFTDSRPRRLEVPFGHAYLGEVDAFLREVADRNGWEAASAIRLRAAGEETLLSLLQPGADDEPDEQRRLTVIARSGNAGVELEFLHFAGGDGTWRTNWLS